MAMRQLSAKKPKHLLAYGPAPAVLHGAAQAAALRGGAARHGQRCGQPAGHLYDTPRREQPGPGDLAACLRRGAHGLHLRPGVLAPSGYTQTHGQEWLRRSLFDIRRDLFAHCRRCPSAGSTTAAGRRRHELFHQRRGHHLGRAEQQLCHGHPELHPDVGHACAALRPQLAGSP